MEIACTVANIFVPGLGSVVSALAVVGKLCVEMKDNQDTCVRVEKRFTDIYNQLLLMERKGTLPRSEAVNRYAELLERFYMFLVKQRKKNVISRLASSNSLQASILGFHEDMDHLLTMLNLAHVDAVASSQQGWEKATLQQQQQLEMVVGNTGILLEELDRQKRLQAHAGDDRKLFVRDLVPETSDEAFRKAFQKYGQLKDAIVARDRDTGKCKGFGFLTFAHKSAVDKALQRPQKMIEVSVCVVDPWELASTCSCARFHDCQGTYCNMHEVFGKPRRSQERCCSSDCVRVAHAANRVLRFSPARLSKCLGSWQSNADTIAVFCARLSDRHELSAAASSFSSSGPHTEASDTSRQEEVMPNGSSIELLA